MLGSRKRKKANMEEATDIDMVPIMNMFLVLIPFLLISANFIHMRIINTSVPVLSESSSSADKDEKKSEIKVTAVVELQKDGLAVSVLSDELSEDEAGKLAVMITNEKKDEYLLQQLSVHLKSIKEKYPESDTVIIIPEETILYENIIQVMDSARYFAETESLFQNVVLSGKVG